MFDSFLQAVAPVSALALVVELIALLLSILLLWWREFAPITRLQDPPKSQFGLIRIAKYQTTDGESLPQNSKTSTAGNGDSPVFTIIWVHGLGSNPDTTWLGNTLRGVQDSRPTLPPELRVNWIEDLLFPDLVALSKTAIEMFHYNYESYWLRDSVQQRLPRMAEDMLMHICHYLSQQIDLGEKRKLIFVAHSFGGLLVKEALVRARSLKRYDDAAKRTAGVLFLGTPHRGFAFVRFAKLRARLLYALGSNSSMLEGLDYDSLVLKDLHSAFFSSFHQLQLVNIYEQRKTVLMKFGGLQLDTSVVDERSATFDAPNGVNIGMLTDHSGLNKFTSRDSLYELIPASLLKIIKNAQNGRFEDQRQCYVVPYNTVSTYTRNKEYFEELAHKIRAHDSVALTGLGGCGKTQLVLDYVETHRHTYDGIFWIDAEDNETISGSFERIRNSLSFGLLSKQNPPITTAISTVDEALDQYATLNMGRSWLFVVDNVHIINDGFEKLIPKAEGGKLILISQDRRCQDLLMKKHACVHMVQLGHSESCRLLLSRLENLEPFSDLVYEKASRAVVILGHFPLAIDCLGMYLSNCSDIVAALDSFPDDLKRHGPNVLSARRPGYYSLTIPRVWERSLKAAEQLQSNSIKLLNFMAFFGNSGLKDELFRLASLGWSDAIFQKQYGNTFELPSWLEEISTSNHGHWDSFAYRQAMEPLFVFDLIDRARTETGQISVTVRPLLRFCILFELNQYSFCKWALSFLSAACYHARKSKEFGSYPMLAHYIVTFQDTRSQQRECLWNGTRKPELTTSVEALKRSGAQPVWSSANELFKTISEHS